MGVVYREVKVHGFVTLQSMVVVCFSVPASFSMSCWLKRLVAEVVFMGVSAFSLSCSFILLSIISITGLAELQRTLQAQIRMCAMSTSLNVPFTAGGSVAPQPLLWVGGVHWGSRKGLHSQQGLECVLAELCGLPFP